MRVPLNWLRDYVDVDVEADRLAERLTVLGMEVKSVERWGADWRNVVVGELLEVRPHPQADRLSLTTVTLGEGSPPLEIVCGATNIAAGQRVPVALPGAVLPGDRRIERTGKMGVVSNGMLCSGDELHLTGDADGILILSPDAPLGTALIDLYGDWILDVDVKPNRGDALSLVGLAREVAAVTGATVRMPPIDVAETGQPTSERLAIDVRDPDLCPRYVARWLSGAVVGPSPDRVQMRLLAAGQRPVSNVVDASNYVMLELGKPIHTFDARAISADGIRPTVIVRTATPGEHLETLDHVVRDLTPDTLIIADRSGPIGIAGVMGGANSEVSPTTRDIVVESAIFDPVSIRRTAFRYALRSESSLRFEKGQEFRLARVGAARTARLIGEWAGAGIAPGVVDTNPNEPAPVRVTFRPGRVNRLLGTELSADDQRHLLERVGVVSEESSAGSLVTVALGPDPLVVEPVPGEAIDAIVPTWRRDIEIEADVAEEVARVAGYETVPPVTPHTPMPGFRATPLETRDAIRQAMVGAGLTEVVTYALVAPRDLDRLPLPKSGAPVPHGEEAAEGEPIHVTNPLSSQHSVLRQRLTPGLLSVLDTNLRQGRDALALFEIGKGYGRRPDGPADWWRLGFAMTGRARPAHWADPDRAFDLDDAKGLVELLARELRLETTGYEPGPSDVTLHPGRSARVLARSGDRIAISGMIGELHPGTADVLEIRAGRIVVGELAIAGLSGGNLAPVRVVAPSRHPAIERDLAIVVDAEVPAGTVAMLIRTEASALLAGLRLFDVYRGAPLRENEKSLAWRLVFAADRTLTDAEVDDVMARVTAGLAAIGGRVRA
jgi:phenylalanyl-tRNA synthetase beta chain